MTVRLNRETLLPSTLSAPVRPDRIGIIHLGVGAFHRAHQAVYTQNAMRATHDLSWGILAVTQRSRSVADQLSPQNGLYSVLVVGDEPELDVIGSIVDVAAPADDTARVLTEFTSPDVHIVTLTVTEAGYPPLGEVTPGSPVLGADLTAAAAEADRYPLGVQPATSTIGLLVRGLAARYRASSQPITLVSCDNLSHNGARLSELVREGLRVAVNDERLLEWFDASVATPSTMVDRLTPAPTGTVRDVVENLLGARDEAAVSAEQFSQWVIADCFSGPRPRWELAGATFTDDVTPYEDAKLRMLNGTHSVLAYTGAVAGVTTIDEAITVPYAFDAARRYLIDAVAATVAPAGMDLDAYAEQILHRFRNAALGHTITKVAADGSLKIPQRWAAVARARLKNGTTPFGVAAGFAAWTQFLMTRPDAVTDPRREELLALAQTAGSPHDLAQSFLRLGILPEDVASNPNFVAAVNETLDGYAG